VKGRTFVSALLALCVAGSGPAFAQGNSNHDRQNGRGDPHQDQRGDMPQGPRGDMHQAPQGSRYDGQGHRNDGARHEGRGAGPDHNYYSGDRVPESYRGHQAVVDDWRGHNLRQPPRGYHWVQYGGDYMLVAITTGVILQLLLNQ